MRELNKEGESRKEVTKDNESRFTSEAINNPNQLVSKSKILDKPHVDAMSLQDTTSYSEGIEFRLLVNPIHPFPLSIKDNISFYSPCFSFLSLEGEAIKLQKSHHTLNTQKDYLKKLILGSKQCRFHQSYPCII